MKIVHDMPPNYTQICQAIPGAGSNLNVIFAYGDILYVPNENAVIPDHLMVHEETHQKQQGDNVEGWWYDYLHNIQFRLKQEVEAYSAQYHYLKTAGYGRPERRRLLEKFAQDLSSEIYGSIILKADAKEVIRAVR